MLTQRATRKPTFFWQGVLILLPVVLLAAVGLFSLRQDKRLTRQEAAQRAQGVAEDLLRIIWIDLTRQGAGATEPHTFQVDAAGQLVFPPPPPALPVPSPLDPDRLSPEQIRLWRLAQAAEIDGHDPASALRAWRDFAESNPPAEFAAPAQYALGLQLAKTGDPRAAAERFASVADKYPDAIGESGLPLHRWRS